MSPFPRSRRSGFALIVVLLVLASLAAIATPFLLSMRSASRVAVHRAAEVRARLAAAGGIDHARGFLADTYPSRDSSPLADGPAELAVPPLPKKGFDFADPRGTILSVRAEDEQGKIHLGSAPPALLASLLGRLAFLTRDAKPDDDELFADETERFPEEGFLWIENELVHYAKREGGRFTGCTRGVSVEPGRTFLPQEHRVGAPVLDDRIHAIAAARVGEGLGGGWRPFDSVAGLSGILPPTPAGKISRDEAQRIAPLATVWSDRMGAGDWTAPVRVHEARKDAYEVWRVLALSNSRDFPPGATVRVENGKQVEHGLVLESNPAQGTVLLEAGLATIPDPYRAKVSALVRHPVNANSASHEVLEHCLRGLRLRSRTRDDSVTRAEARGIADRIVAARPILGFEDFYRRVLEPGLKDGAISERDLQAIHRNALNGNDAHLEFSTMPFTFASGDVYALEASASVNARSGVERARGTLREIRAVRPQEDLFLALGTQAGFDDHLRLTRASRFWMSGPANTSMWDGPNVPPSRAIPHLGLAGLDRQVFPSEKPEESWLQPWPSRLGDVLPYAGRVEHFDFERTPEGRDARKEATAFPAAGSPVGLADGSGVLWPGSMEGWFRFDGAPAAGSVLLDLGATSLDRDRISLLVEGTDLVLRVYDGGGEDRGQPFSTPGLDAGEARVPISQFRENTWYHFLASFRGSRPSDLLLQVDGFKRGEAYGLTRLTNSISPTDATIPIESNKGFPQTGPFVVRIGGEIGGAGGVGGELAEVRLQGNALQSTWVGAGNAGQSFTGGRGAREFGPDGRTGYEIPGGGFSHSRGEAVELYGFAAPLDSPLPLGGATLPEELGRFTVAYVMSIPNPEDQIVAATFQGQSGVPWGTGIYDLATEWTLVPVDSNETDFAKAFQADGGYALVFQFKALNGISETPNGDPICGAELVRYASRQGDVLTVPLSGRGIATAKFPGTNTGFVAKKHAFLLNMDGGISVTIQDGGQSFTLPADMTSDPQSRIYVVPLSIGSLEVNGTAYLDPVTTGVLSQYVQLYRASDDWLTEWVRYDEILETFLVRTDPGFLGAVVAASPAFPTPAQQAPPEVTGAGTIGSPDTLTGSEALAVDNMRRALRMRGVHGTFTHAQAAGTELIPVFRTGFSAGRPGRHDRVAVVEALPSTAAPFHYTVNWSAWNAESDGTPLVAFKERTGNLYLRTTGLQPPAHLDSRNWTRLLKSPSGELPRTATRFSAGAAFDGSGGVMNGLLDEVAFTTSTVPGAAYHPHSLGRFLLVDTGGIDENQTTLRLSTSLASFPHGIWSLDNLANPVDSLPVDAGVFKIGDELLAFRQVAAGTGTITVASGATGALRGIFGSTKSAHGPGSALVFLDHWVATGLASGASGASSNLRLEDPAGFPPEGTARVDDELLHWTRIWNGGLEMPRRSEEPGADDEKGDGLLRGRFGTTPATHAADAVAFLWPFRFWDRARARADAPEMAFYQVNLRAEDAWFRRLLWQEEIPAHGVDLVALARVDEAVPWDADPATGRDLRRFTDPLENGRPVEIGRQGSRLEVRFFAEYLPGAFDPLLGLAEGWKAAPRIRTIAVDYLAPDRLLRREERRW